MDKGEARRGEVAAWETIICAGYRVHPEVQAEREHTITVVVDDGTDLVEDGFVIEVKEEEGSPGPDLVVILAAVVLAALVRVRQRGRRPD